jgi:hypothetical protein
MMLLHCIQTEQTCSAFCYMYGREQESNLLSVYESDPAQFERVFPLHFPSLIAGTLQGSVPRTRIKLCVEKRKIVDI